MKKIAILTITDGQNYGNRLQNYALQEILKKEGFHVETIKRRTFKDINKTTILRIKFVNLVKTVIKMPLNIHVLRAKKFNNFNFKYIDFANVVLHDNISPKNLDSKYDFFVVGSDQVWNAGFRIVYEDILNHLASFASKEKRVAYSASFGTERIAKGYEHYFESELPKFKAISVREESGVKLVEQFGVKAEVVLDPTMLLSNKEWLKIAKKPNYVSSTHFVVTYFLGGRDEKIRDYIKRIACKKQVYNLEIESATAENIDSVDVFSTSPDEFIWLIANSDCVITDSFHATVFSILFNKPFCVFDRKAINESYKMGSRIETLLGMFNLERFRDTDRNFQVIPEKYETDEIEKILAQKRNKSIDFLRRALTE